MVTTDPAQAAPPCVLAHRDRLRLRQSAKVREALHAWWVMVPKVRRCVPLPPGASATKKPTKALDLPYPDHPGVTYGVKGEVYTVA